MITSLVNLVQTASKAVKPAKIGPGKSKIDDLVINTSGKQVVKNSPTRGQHVLYGMLFDWLA